MKNIWLWCKKEFLIAALYIAYMMIIFAVHLPSKMMLFLLGRSFHIIFLVMNNSDDIDIMSEPITVRLGEIAYAMEPILPKKNL